MVRSVNRFHVYYHVMRVLKRLQIFPYELGFNVTNNLYSGQGFFKLCEDYEVPHDPMKYMDENFCQTYQWRCKMAGRLHSSIPNDMLDH